MESNNNKNNESNDGGDKHQQLRGSAQSNKFANGENKPAATGDDQNCSSNKKLEEGNDLDLELENLPREELIKLVRKQMATIMEMEAQKKLETIKKEEEESANQVEIAQLKQEKAKLQEELHQKIAEIEEMHKEVEEKSEEVAEKANQIDALLMQLNELTSHQPQIGLPTEEQEMKIQLPLENWFDLLALVPRSQLGQIVSQIGDRRFTRIIQAFLHEHGEITLGKMLIIPPRRNVPSDRPMVKAQLLPDWPMPGNIKSFNAIDFNFCYMDMFVLDFLQKFQQNSLLVNVHLSLKGDLTENLLLGILAQILPLVDSIDSINSESLDLFKMAYNNNDEDYDDDDQNDNQDEDDKYDYGNSNVSNQSQLMLKTMMEQTRVLDMPVNCFRSHLWIDWCCSWLYIPRDDGKPRMLNSYAVFRMDLTHLSSFTERIIKDFKMANKSSSFFIRIYYDQNKNVPYICLDNAETNEQLVIKANELHDDDGWQMMISRYPSEADKNWIEANEKEICDWDEREVDRKLILEEEDYY